MHVWNIISLDLLWETQKYVFSSYISYDDLSHITWTQKMVLLCILRWNSSSLCLLDLLDIHKDLNERLIVRADKEIHEHTGAFLLA
jgi:hypothetical protein